MKFVARFLTDKILKQYDKAIEKYSRKQITAGLAVAGSLFFVPGAYYELRYRTKMFAPALVKEVMRGPEYEREVNNLRPIVQGARLAQRSKLNSEEVREILDGFCKIKENVYEEVMQAKIEELSFYAERRDTKDFVKAYKIYGAKELNLVDYLLRYFLMDLGMTISMERKFKRAMYRPENSYIYSTYIIKAYALKFDKHLCTREHLKDINILLSTTKQSGKMELFGNLSKEGKLEDRMVQDYYAYQYYMQNGVLLEPCYHYQSVKTYNKNHKILINHIRDLNYNLTSFLEGIEDDSKKAEIAPLRQHKVVDYSTDKSLLHRRQQHEGRIDRRIEMDPRKEKVNLRKQQKRNFENIERLNQTESEFNKDFLWSEKHAENDAEEGRFDFGVDKKK